MNPAALRQSHARQTRRALAALALLLALGFVVSLMVGRSFIPPQNLLALFGGAEDGAFTLRQLRLPRALVAILAGAGFGMGGAAFQTLLRNPLASPDIIGISAGASTAAVFAIVGLGLGGATVAVLAVAAGLGVALLIGGLAWQDGLNSTRLILVGIGVAALMQSATAYLLSRAPSWSLQEAMRWMAGSVNGAQLEQALPLALALAVFGAMLLARSADLAVMQLGDEAAAGLGVALGPARLQVIFAAVGLVAVATATVGPVAFVAFLAGPIGGRLVPRGGLRAAALTGAALVLGGDFIGQVLLPARLPVGVVTGALGAPYLVLLILRQNRAENL